MSYGMLGNFDEGEYSFLHEPCFIPLKEKPVPICTTIYRLCFSILPLVGRLYRSGKSGNALAI